MVTRKAGPVELVTMGHIRCTRCGHIGADVRPDWSPHVNKRHV
jgi:uncharacterized C2H2 Zn-finger protein